MFDGARDYDDGDDLRPARGIFGSALICLICAALLVLVLCLSFGNARAQMSGALINCSQTVAASAAPVVFPTSGSGPSAPQVYLRLCNAHASNTLGVNPLPGGTAAIGSAGTLTLAAGACLVFDQAPIPPAISIIGSAGSTTTACWYR